MKQINLCILWANVKRMRSARYSESVTFDRKISEMIICKSVCLLYCLSFGGPALGGNSHLVRPWCLMMAVHCSGTPGYCPGPKKYNLTSSGDFKACGSSSWCYNPLKSLRTKKCIGSNWPHLRIFSFTLHWGSEDRNGVLRMRKEIKC